MCGDFGHIVFAECFIANVIEEIRSYMNFAENYSMRYLEPKDLDQYNALLRYTFQVTEDELIATGWKDEDIKQSKFPVLERADVLGCFDGDTLVSQFAVYPLKMNIYGEVFQVGFVTSVCTYPEYTGQGIMKKLMFGSYETAGKMLCAAVPVFHSTLSPSWMGDHIQQDLVQYQRPADSDQGQGTRLCAPRGLG